MATFDTIMGDCQKIIDNPSLTVQKTLKAVKQNGVWCTQPVALLGAGVIAGGAAPLTFGALMAPALWIGGPAFWIYRWLTKNKREKLEKERMYQEVIRKQQAAINRQREVNTKLEEKLREAVAKNKKNEADINDLKEQIRNLEELIEILSQMKNAA